MLISLINSFNININWLLTGAGSMFSKDTEKEKNFAFKVKELLKQEGLL